MLVFAGWKDNNLESRTYYRPEQEILLIHEVMMMMMMNPGHSKHVIRVKLHLLEASDILVCFD
jgi:hypothetical protein